MMAVPFTFRSSTPHVPGEGRSSFATLHKGGVGGKFIGGHTPYRALALPFGSRHTEAGCMQCFRSKHKHLSTLVFCVFSFPFSASGPHLAPEVQSIVTSGTLWLPKL